MNKHDPMGDRLKAFEQIETSRRCDPTKPICIRLDGRAFSTFTKGLARPYDARMSRLMIDTTKFLVNETHAKIGYTQSDEITLIYAYEGEAQPLFGGKFHKLTSLLAGLCSAQFNNLLQRRIPEKWGVCPSFDARVFQVPDKMEAANVVLWRWFDAKKNSVSMLAQSVFSHKQLQGKDAQEMREMLLEQGYDWNTYPDFFKWGTFVQRKTVERELTSEEKAKIPEKFQPEGLVKRSQVEELAMPPFRDVANRVSVIFDGEEPKLLSLF